MNLADASHPVGDDNTNGLFDFAAKAGFTYKVYTFICRA